MKKTIFYIFVITIIILIILRAEDVILYARDAMKMCYEIIIPTLFPFFICSSLLIYSGFGSVMAKLTSKIMRPLFNVPPSGAAAFVLGIISGFPVGSITCVQLYKSGALSKSEAERLLAFCNNSGPLFIIGSVGVAIYGKLSYGLILYLIHILTSLAVGIIFRSYNKNKHNSPPLVLTTNEMPLGEVVSLSLSNASGNILSVCFCIIFFSSVCRVLLSLVPLSNFADAAANGLFEFSTGILKTSMLDISLYKKFLTTSFILGFSGLSVHFQVMSVTAQSGLSLKPYILGKLLHSTLALLVSAVVFRFLPLSTHVFSSSAPVLSVSFMTIVMMLLIANTVIAVVTLLFFMGCKKCRR
jgi:sporulation integral membrane protein YlbJ